MMMWMHQSSKLSPQDKKDLEKFTKYFVYKCVQVIVQSRLADKVQTHSKAVSTGADWFNLAIRDIAEVQSETKRVISGQSGASSDQNICIEISLKTSEGDVMILETWWLGIEEQCDPSVRVSYTVYNRMGILLKSLICVTRVTPAYSLSRKQGPDSYVICYRVYLGEPQLHTLGDGSQTKQVGLVPTPAGTLYAKVAYRTKMLISPKCSMRDMSVDLKDDHFMADLSPKKTSNAVRPCQPNGREPHPDGDETGPIWAESEVCATSFSTSPPDHSCHLGQKRPAGKLTRKPSGDKIQHKVDAENNRQKSFSQIEKLGAFAPQRPADIKPDSEEIPFISLLNLHEKVESPQPTENGVSNHSNGCQDEMEGSAGSEKSSTSHASAPDDFVMVELKTPFAAADSKSDLGKFYRDCQGAPPLTMFDSQSDLNETVTEITEQLATFEANLTEFDDFVDSLQTSED